MGRKLSTILTYSIGMVRNGRYMGGVIRQDGRSSNCGCGGVFTSSSSALFTHKVPLCSKCSLPPKALKVRITLPAIGKCDVRYNLKGTRLTTLALADAFLQDVHDEIRRGSFDPSRYLSPKKRDCLKISSLLDNYLESKRQNVGREKGCSPAYVRGAEIAVRKYLKPAFGDLDVREVRHRHLVDFLESKAGPERQRIKALQLLRPVLRRARKMIDGLVIPEFPTLKPAAMKRAFIDHETQRLVLSKVTTYREAIEFGILYLLRPCELRALQWGDIDRKRNVITVQRHFSERTLMPGRKSAVDPNDRYHKLELPLTATAWAILNRLPTSIDPKQFIFQGVRGGPLGEPALNKQWKKACGLASVAEHGFYDGGRHAGASHLLNAGVPIERIRALCGHSDANTTQRYAEADTLSLGDMLEKPRGVQMGCILPIEKKSP